MSLLTLEAKNFQIHRDLKIDLNKESAIVIGDSGTGKSTLSRIILSHLAQVPYPSNPLSDGENEGYTKTTHQGPDGKVYTVSRKYVRGENGSVKLAKFEVRGPDGRRKSLEEIMETVFDGVFTSARFDFNTFFNKKKGPVDRYKYFVDAIGGKAIEDNIIEIEEIEEARAKIGKDRDTQRAIWEQMQIPDDDDELARQYEYYSKKKEASEASELRDAHLLKQKPLADHEAKLNIHTKAIEMIRLDNIAIASYEEEIDDLEKQIIELQRRIGEKQTQVTSRLALRAEQQKNVLSDKSLAKLSKEINKIEAHNKKLSEEADKVYNTALNDIMEFNSKRDQFINGIKAYAAWDELNNQWNQKQERIAELKGHNEKLLSKLLPLPELSIGEHNGKPMILYNGREFSADYLSTGEQIQITAAIQVALNPNGDNFIVIPNAQDLGSKLRDVQEACKKFNVQYLVEMTKPDQEFRVEVIDSEMDIVSL